LFYFFKTLETAKGFGPKTLETLVSNGYSSIENVFALKEQDFLDMEFGDKQAENLSQALKDCSSTAIEDARFLAAFGIEDLGIGASRKLLSVHPFDTLNTLSKEAINAIDGFGEKTSSGIATALTEQWSTITQIKGLGFKLTPTPLTSEFESIESPIAGKTILFTGKMEQNRDEMEVEARGLGAVVVSSVSGKLQILVTGAKASAGKIAKAKNATVYTEEEYNTLIGK
jgi:DNA ligase (NAD+)